jgi:hypothetical protein
VAFQIAIAQFDGGTSLRVPPLAAGLLASTVRREPDLADVDVRVLAARVAVDAAAAAIDGAAILGISLYTWNARYALEVARRAKARRPALRVVAGGPSVPRRPDEYAAFFDGHPWVDAIVLGEGELAFAEIVRATRAGSPLQEIAGVVARDTGAIVVGPPRTRLEGDAFERIGSPYLDGTFDELVARGELPAITAVVLETNRGCPFACTFCDWGQATHSRVHELPSDRIERELAWIGERGVSYLYLVDANFGIRRRDVEITRVIGEVSRARGAPQFVFFHLTKNATEKNLRTVEILRDHGVGTQVALSMQDFDGDVLRAIRRDNIRPAAALALRERCHAKGLTTVNELMLGLPAQTAASIRDSVVAAITPFPGDSFHLYPTRVLANAELAEPAYRARYGIETRRVPWWPTDPAEDLHVVEYEQLVVATTSLPVDAWRAAYAFGYTLSALWNRRLLQTTLHVLRFALGVDLAAFVDALLGSEGPRARAIRDELARFSSAIVDAEASTLPIAGWGAVRREPADAVCACVFDDVDGFYAEAADQAARLVGAAHEPLVRDAVAWDALRIPRIGATPPIARFEYDWLAYDATMGTRPQPIHRALAVRTVSPTLASDPATRVVALDWLARNRVELERLDATPPSRRFVAVPSEPASLHRRAHDDGFVYLPGALPAARLAPLRGVVDAALAARRWIVDGRSDPALRLGSWDDPRWLAFFAEIASSEAYQALARAPELVGALRAIMGAEPELFVGDVCRLVSPGAIDRTSPPHQDAAYFSDANDVWTAWFPLGPCPLALGPLAVVAGSHRDGVRPHAPSTRVSGGVIATPIDGDAPWCSLDLDAGDVVMFSALAVHCALPNVTSDRLRVSVDYRYRPARATGGK